MKGLKMTGALAGVLMMAATTAHAEVKDCSGWLFNARPGFNAL